MDEKTFFKYQTPKKYQNCSLESCDKIPRQIVQWAENWAKNPTSVFIYGNYGCGKTHLAFAMIRQIFRVCPKKLWPRYFTSPDFDARLLAAARAEKGDREEVDDRKKEDLLFIDDLGREMKSERLKRQYFEIFNYRYCEELPTILTSNLSLDRLGDTLDGSISSRIQEWTIIEIKGHDIRKEL